MKKYLLIFIAGILLSACDLNLKSVSDLTYAGYWSSEEAVKAAHAGVYVKYRTYANTFFQMGEMRSDIWGGKTIGEEPWDANLYRNNFEITTAPFGNWSNFYGLLHYVNDFIKNAPSVNFKKPTERDNMLAQVYGIRAHIYYTMLRAWGDVPISLEPLTTVNLEALKKGRSPKAEVMTQIKADLAKSLELFGNDNSLWLGKNTYWSKSATLALKGDVYLWSGMVLGGGNVDFTEAKTALSEITGFDLPVWDKVWGQTNEANKEFIFAFDYDKDQAENIYISFTGNKSYFKTLIDESGASLTNFVLSGQNRYGVSDKVLALLDDAKDARRNTFMRTYEIDKNGVKVYQGSVLNKFLGIVDTDGLRKNWNNVPLYRYADVLLMLAEAKNNLGEDPSAEINAVRKRGYGANYGVAQTYTNADKITNTKAILDERLKEFIGEGKRWWDLVRAGGDHLYNEVPTMKKTEAYKIYYPITNGMIANDEMLKQTEGWK